MKFSLILSILIILSVNMFAQTTPCNNERLIYLQQQDTLNLYESDELIVLTHYCKEYQKALNEPIKTPDERIADATEQIANSQETIATVTIISLIISLVVGILIVAQ